MEKSEHMEKLRQSKYPWMNDDQFECWCMFCDLMGGDHHISGKFKPAGPNGVEVCDIGINHWASFDFNGLTRAIVFAHDRCIRFAISPCNMQLFRFYLHKRKPTGRMSERHPTLEDHIKYIRGRYKKEL